MRQCWVVGVAVIVIAMAAAGCGGGGTKPPATTTCPTASPQSISPPSSATASTTRPSCLSQPAGEDWKGTVDMIQHETGDYGDCSKSAKGQVDFVVDSTGKVKGTATGPYMSNEAGCNPTNPKASISGSGTWPVIGQSTGQEFQLRFYPPIGYLDETLTVPIVSATASAQIHNQLPSATGPIDRTYSINLTCTNC